MEKEILSDKSKVLEMLDKNPYTYDIASRLSDDLKNDKDIALKVAMERIVKLEDELIYAKAIAEQLIQELQELKEQQENNE